MENQASNPLSWHALIATLGILAVMLGVEQALPIPDKVRTPIGVLIVLLTIDFWNLFNMVRLPGAHKKR